tara:strand:- start:21 stop:281 length:261 start_codon:yes stop_codon:yes gene_type:complete
MEVTVEILLTVSHVLTYLVKDILSLDSVFKYIFIFVHMLFELTLKILDIISISLRFIINFNWDRYMIYLNMYLNKIYSIVSGGNSW